MGMLPGGARRPRCVAQQQLARRRDQCSPTSTRRATRRASWRAKIGRTIPLVYGSGGLGGVAAHALEADMNENAKAPAFWNAYPELDHNEICGWGQHGDVTRQVFTLVELRHGFEHPRLERRGRWRRGELIEEAWARCSRSRPRGRGASPSCST